MKESLTIIAVVLLLLLVGVSATYAEIADKWNICRGLGHGRAYCVLFVGK